MKKISMKSVAVLLALGMGSVMAEELPMTWNGYKGLAPETPKMVQFASKATPTKAAADGEKAIGVTVTAVADGKYQQLENHFETPIDLSKYSGIAFDLKQDVYSPIARFHIRFIFSNNTAIHTSFLSGPKGEWKHVEILFEEGAEWIDLDKYGFGTASLLSLFPASNMDKTGKSFSVANVELIEK